MVLYCLKSSGKTETKNRQVTKTNKEKIVLLSKCEVTKSKTLRFIKTKQNKKKNYKGY